MEIAKRENLSRGRQTCRWNFISYIKDSSANHVCQVQLAAIKKKTYLWFRFFLSQRSDDACFNYIVDSIKRTLSHVHALTPLFVIYKVKASIISPFLFYLTSLHTPQTISEFANINYVTHAYAIVFGPMFAYNNMP